MPHFVATLVRHLRSRIVWGSNTAGFVRCRSLHLRVKHVFLPLRGNFTSSNEIVVTYSYLYSNVPISLLMVKRFSGASSTCPTTCASMLKLRDMSMMACASSGLT